MPAWARNSKDLVGIPGYRKKLSEGKPYTSSSSKFPMKNVTQESPWRTSPTTSQGTHLASKNSEKKSVLSKTAPKQSQGGKNARWSAGFPYHTDWIQLAPLRLFTETLEISSYIANVILNQSSVSSTKGLSHSSLT